MKKKKSFLKKWLVPIGTVVIVGFIILAIIHEIAGWTFLYLN